MAKKKKQKKSNQAGNREQKPSFIHPPSSHDMSPTPEPKGWLEKIMARFHRHPAVFLAVGCGVICVSLIVVYMTTKFYLSAHYSAVFLELALAILFIEEIIKPKVEGAEAKRIKREKKRSFLRNLLRHNVDVMMADYLREFEDFTNILTLSEEELSEPKKRAKARMRLVQHYRKYFHYFDKLRPFHGNVLKDGTANEDAPEETTEEHFFEAWETLLEEALENVQLVCPKPQYTPYHSWDMLIAWYTDLKAHNHELRYLNQDLTREQTQIKLYLAGMKALVSLMLDLQHFRISDESKIDNEQTRTLARKVWHVWMQKSSRS